MQPQGLLDDREEVRDGARLGVADDGVGVAVRRDARGGHVGAQPGDGDGRGGDEEDGGAEGGRRGVGAGDELEKTAPFGFPGVHAVRDEGVEHVRSLNGFFAEAGRGLAAGESVWKGGLALWTK